MGILTQQLNILCDLSVEVEEMDIVCEQHIWLNWSLPEGSVRLIDLAVQAQCCIDLLTTGTPSIYKIGITSSPPYRFFNIDFGYFWDDYTAMQVLMKADPKSCGLLERALIAKNLGHPGCRNINPGGETLPESGPCYTYIVHVASDDILPNRRARKRLLKKCE